MNAPPHIRAVKPHPFGGVAATAAEHFRLAVFGAIAQLIEACAEGDRAAAMSAHPFLASYAQEIARLLGRPESSAAQWRQALSDWEDAAPAGLPLRALVAAGLNRLDLELLLAAGLPDEDPRFCDLFEQATGRERRPTVALLIAWWRAGDAGNDRADAVRQSLLGMLRLGLLHVLNPGAPRSEWQFAVPAPLWDALRGETPSLPWLRYEPAAQLLPLARYIAPDEVMQARERLPRLLARTPGQLLIVRGPQQNGRKTLVGAVARAMGMGVLVANEAALEEAHWRLFGVLACVLGALPVVELRLTPGDNRMLPALPLVSGPMAVVTGASGGIHSEDGRPIVSLTLALPPPACRLRHWQTVAPGQNDETLAAEAHAFRLSAGNIHRAARAALGHAALDGRDTIAPRDVKLACRSLHGARLETVATRLEACGTLNGLALDDIAQRDVETLLARCRHREALAAEEDDGAACGVRALFSGPSGTGKTLAARIVAAVLEKDLYRIDLATTVNKYLGETEKNLDRAFAAAEELDIVLLLDEGDALMAARTDVSSSNDRYANLETNFLLQRIEAFGGILIVTTNAADRIDKAFSRRMDVVIPFRMPDELRRYEILRLELGAHAIEEDFLEEVACRCALSGGQLRNIALHARLLSLDASEPLGERHMRTALGREYRKMGAHCPLKSVGVAGEM